MSCKQETLLYYGAFGVGAVGWACDCVPREPKVPPAQEHTILDIHTHTHTLYIYIFIYESEPFCVAVECVPFALSPTTRIKKSYIMDGIVRDEGRERKQASKKKEYWSKQHLCHVLYTRNGTTLTIFIEDTRVACCAWERTSTYSLSICTLFDIRYTWCLCVSCAVLYVWQWTQGSFALCNQNILTAIVFICMLLFCHAHRIRNCICTSEWI